MFMLCFFDPEPCVIWFPDREWSRHPSALDGEVITPGPQGSPQSCPGPQSSGKGLGMAGSDEVLKWRSSSCRRLRGDDCCPEYPVLGEMTSCTAAPGFPLCARADAVPSLFGTSDQCHGRQFSHGLGQGGKCFGDDSSVLHLLCTLFLLLL